MIVASVRDRSVRNKRLLQWNFMEELLKKYDKASRNGGSTVFKIRDFESIRLPIFSMDEPFIFETLMEYERLRGFIRIHDGFVALTSKGLLKARETRKDWD